MKKAFMIIILPLLFHAKNVFAYDSSNYVNRDLCGNFEVAEFYSDGRINPVSCNANYNDASSFMRNNGSNNLAIMTKVNGRTKIIDANVALLDLSVNEETLTYFYTNKELNSSSYTYMDTGSLYGGVDGAHLESYYSPSKNIWTAKVRIGNFTGWIKQSTYEIVPITWIKSVSSYTVTNEDIRHNYVAKIQNEYYKSAGRTIGPKPEMLSAGKYYSYDGHYFYRDLETLIRDYKNNNYNNSVNKDNPYYNYYMYVSNHTRTNYSSVNIDEYIRNNLGYTKNVYGNAANTNTSRLYGSGTFFYYAQEKYGVNAILSLSLSRNETGNGTSNLSINKNNGFGLNAVDSNPTQAANWYASFASSILGYASKWITYGYAHPRDWRYFGPQFGDKWIGMNVKYASDTYWSEKMAANYYSLDKAFGLQDYNYYQLGVVNSSTKAYMRPSTQSKLIYEYPEKEDALVIVGEENVNNEKWYKVVSDLNIDSNGNEITSGNYNWNAYVYVKASQVTKINKGKNGYINPNQTPEYEDRNYEYDLYIENTELKPRVAQTVKDAKYYYDSTLTQTTGNTVLKDKYVIVYTAAIKNGIPVSYLVTSDYFYDQKHWVSADSIKFTNVSYGKVSVTVSGNQYTWVNYNTEDAKYSLISGLYTNSYVPVLDQVVVGNDTWYKVPVSLTSNTNSYGYTLKEFPGVKIELNQTIVKDMPPVINAKDKNVRENSEFNPLDDVTAQDPEDGIITNKIEIIDNNVDTKKPGEYHVTYKVKDTKDNETTKTIKVTVIENHAPVINAQDKITIKDHEIDLLDQVSAADLEDGDITSKITIEKNNLDIAKVGEYSVTYKVIDSEKKEVTKEIKVTVIEQKPIDELTEKTGELYLESLEWNKDKKYFNISGYLIIEKVNNTQNKEYYLILKDKNSDKEYQIKILPWIENTPYDLGNENENSYTNSWFKGKIDFNDIPKGDYDLYMKATDCLYYTEQILDNLFNRPITKRGEDENAGYNFKVLNNLKSKKMELNIRKELYTTKESPTFRTMVNDFEEIKFVNEKLYMLGYSYNYGGTYSNSKDITRTLILEDQETYNQYYFDLGATENGAYKITTLDKKDKKFAWYEKEINLSEIPKGTYTLQVYTKTTDATDYGEITDLFQSLKTQTTEINSKEYTITLNKNRQNRVELIIK